MIWYWIVFGVATTYLATGLIFREIKVERWRDRAERHCIAANRLSRSSWDGLTGESMQQAHKAWRCARIADRHAKTMRIFWPFLREG